MRRQLSAAAAIGFFMALGAVSAHAAQMPDERLSVAAAAQLPVEAIAGENVGKPAARKAIQLAHRRKRRRRRRNRGGGVAAGVILGLFGAAIINEAARSSERKHYRRCYRWARQCDRGYLRACDRLDYHCY